eukprot:scaffold330_cov246-Pinguiococcus_pyrenoidosus.AAC.2
MKGERKKKKGKRLGDKSTSSNRKPQLRATCTNFLDGSCQQHQSPGQAALLPWVASRRRNLSAAVHPELQTFKPPGKTAPRPLVRKELNLRLGATQERLRAASRAPSPLHVRRWRRVSSERQCERAAAPVTSGSAARSEMVSVRWLVGAALLTLQAPARGLRHGSRPGWRRMPVLRATPEDSMFLFEEEYDAEAFLDSPTAPVETSTVPGQKLLRLMSEYVRGEVRNLGDTGPVPLPGD